MPCYVALDSKLINICSENYRSKVRNELLEKLWLLLELSHMEKPNCKIGFFHF